MKKLVLESKFCTCISETFSNNEFYQHVLYKYRIPSTVYLFIVATRRFWCYFQTHSVKCFKSYSYIHNVNGLYLKETLQSSLKSVCHLPLSKEVKRPADGFSVLTMKHISFFHVSAFDSIIKWDLVFFHQSYHRSFGNRKGENTHDSERSGGRSWHHQTPAYDQRDSGSWDHHRPHQLHHQHQGKRRPVPQLCKSSLNHSMADRK